MSREPYHLATLPKCEIPRCLYDPQNPGGGAAVFHRIQRLMNHCPTIGLCTGQRGRTISQ
jgi:hypothetical protein